MERNTERHTLSFSKGVTNVPNDLLSGDNELSECDGFVYKAGSMVPVQAPQKIGNILEKIMYVHKGADYENIICYNEDNSLLHFYKRDGSTITSLSTKTLKGVKTINSVGNTLICITASTTYYFLFKSNDYTALGSEMPTPSIKVYFPVTNNTRLGGSQCLLQELVETYNRIYYFDTEGNFTGTGSGWGTHLDDVRYRASTLSFAMPTETDKYNAVQAAIQGHVSEKIKLCKERKRFMYPFFIRVALKLFDGSYTKISNPILCYPTINRNECLVHAYYENGSWNEIDEKHMNTYYNTVTYDEQVTISHSLFWFPYHGEMVFQPNATGDYWNWSDIIKEFVVFATPEVLPFKLESEWSLGLAQDINGKTRMNAIDGFYDTWINKTYNFGLPSLNSKLTVPMTVVQPTYKTETEMIDELLTKTQFYKLFSVDFDNPKCGFGDTISFIWENHASDYIKDGVLENLEEQEQLPVDDYYGWTSLVPASMYAYNNRINAFSLKRYPFKGFNYFTGNYNSVIMDATTKAKPNVTFYTYIESETMKAWVKSDETARLLSTDGWVYYPDPNAKKMLIYENNTKKGVLVSLKRHSLLNGAYSFQHLPDTSKVGMTFEDVELPTVDETAYETLDSQIYTSVVNNPFVFEASGDNTVGTGKILGIVANTEAVSQGQFGQYPLLIFTSEGVYGMSVNSEGLYSASYPISREVANENSPFVPTDRLVFFTSEKGLMAVSGGSVVCVSEQLRGRDDGNGVAGRFTDFMKDCMIAYDYRDSMLRIFKKGLSVQYVYNMEDKTFSTVSSGIDAQSVVNDYPDNLIQDTDGNVYSLTEKPGINEDVKKYSGTIKTRPLKLGGSMTLKSLRRIKNLVDSKGGAKLSMKIHASNNAANWAELNSLKGKPWSYFIFEYKLEDFYACDAFVGTIVDIQNRRDAK